jgi:hypothetical protein
MQSVRWCSLFSFVVIALCDAGKCEDLGSIRSFWADMELVVRNHNVIHERSVDGDIYSTGEFLRDEDHLLIVGNREDSSTVNLANGHYMATIGNRVGESWRIRWIGTSEGVINDGGGGTFANLFIMQICDPGGVATILKNHDLASEVKFMDNEAGYWFTLASSLPEGCGIHPSYANAEVRIYGSLNQYPTMCEIMERRTSTTKAVGTRLEYESFVAVRGIKIPTRVKASTIDNFGGNPRNASLYKYDYSSFDELLNKDRCYLRFYGLPEPSGEGNKSRLLLLIMVVVGGLVVLGILRRRGSSTEAL